jgi:predicted nucleic acid-binding protein
MTEYPDHPVVYLDTNPFIYLVEGSDEIAYPVERLMKLLRSKPGLGATSELTIAEVLPKAPTPNHRRSYMNLILWGKILKLLPVSRGVLIETAYYRRKAVRRRDDGSTSFPKLPDAIHIVTAIRSGCRFILSRDNRLRLPRGLRQFTSDPVGIADLMRELA